MTVLQAQVAPDTGDLVPIPFAWTEISADAVDAASRVLASGWVTTGPETLAFETELAEHLGAEHVVAVASCTAAIELALRGLRLSPGSIVLTPTLTFGGAVHAILHAGLQPFLVDCDVDTLQPDADMVAAAARRAGAPAAMVVQHMAGFPLDVAEHAEAAGLAMRRVVEDAAHATGTVGVDGRPVGSRSTAACLSFYATKNLPIGEGGALVTDDKGLAEDTRSRRLHGMSADAWNRYLPGSRSRYDIGLDGLKANLTDVQAAIGRAQLRHLDAWQRRRADIAQRYDEGLAEVPGLVLPTTPRAGGHAWHLYVVRVLPEFGCTRDELADRLRQLGIGTSVHFTPIHHLSYFRRVLPPNARSGLHVADLLAEQVLSLPIHPRLSDAAVDRVIAGVAGAGGHGRASRHAGDLAAVVPYPDGF